MTIINNKLINLLKSLSSKEINEFKKFISSPFYTKGRNYLPFLIQLLKYDTGGFENINTHELFNKIYPGRKFSNQTLKNRFSELYKLGEEFLVYLGLEKNTDKKNNLLLKMLLEKKLYNPFESRFKKTVKQLSDEKFDKNKVFNMSLFIDLNTEFLKERNKMEILYNQYYNNSQFNLCYYFINLFEYGVEFSLQEYDNRKYATNIIVDFLKSLKINDLMNSFSQSDLYIFKFTAMYYYLYKAYENPDSEEYYFLSKKLFDEVSSEIKEGFKTQILNNMIYYCIRKQNEGIKKFQYELFNLYNEKLNQGLFSDLREKVYLINGFRDYVYIGIAVKEYKWVDNFIKKYSKELPAKFKDDEIKLSYAKVFFSNSHYEKSLLSLVNIKTSNYLQYTDSSILKLCCYYELEKYEEAFLELDKLKHYIRNHKEIPEIHLDHISNFIVCYQKLIKIFTQPDKKEIGYLEKEINKSKLISKREWLLDKIGRIVN